MNDNRRTSAGKTSVISESPGRATLPATGILWVFRGKLPLVLTLAGVSFCFGGCGSTGSTPPNDSGGGLDTPTGVGGIGGKTGGTGGITGGTGGVVADSGIDVQQDVLLDVAPPPDPCDGKDKKKLPYVIHSDFAPKVIGAAADFKYITPANCEATTFPPIPVIVHDAGSDGAEGGTEADGRTDAGDAKTDATDAKTDATDAKTDATDAKTDATDAKTDATDSGKQDAADGGAEVADVAADGTEAGADAEPLPSCYEFLFNPTCENNAAGCWAGAIFQHGSSAAGGVCIATGATRITFVARASRPDARVKFGAIRDGVGTYEFWMNLTTTWAPYEITIPDPQTYNSVNSPAGVWNGFSVVVEPQDHQGGTYILVKDVTWWAN